MLLNSIPELRRLLRMLDLPNGLKISISPSEDYFRSILATYGEIYVQRTYEKFGEYAIRRGENVLDVGAFVGLYTLNAAVKGGSESVVYSIEPCPLSYYYLKTNITVNELDNVIALNTAFGSTSGTMLMSYTNLPIYFSVNSEHQNARYKQTVKTLSMDDFCLLHDIGHIDIAKIDAEGAELDIVRGAGLTLSKGVISRMVIEVHKMIYGRSPYTIEQITEALSDYGYVTDHVVDVDTHSSIVYVKHHK